MKLFDYKNENTNIIVRFLGIKFTIAKRINKSAIDKKIKSFKTYCLTEEKRTPKLIVSLTSFPQRMKDIHYCIYSLLNQTLKPDEIILWLAEEEFPNKEKDLPETILKFKENGLTIKWCKNIKSYKKLIPALKKYPDEIIVTADDDVYYPANWLEILYSSYLENPEYIHCHTAHKIKFNDKKEIEPYAKWDKLVKNEKPSSLNFFTGVGGVLYPPHSLYKDVLNEELFTKLAPNADDIWFWAMCVLNKRKINVVQNCINKCLSVNLERDLQKTNEFTLYKINETQNDVQLKQVLDFYPDLISYIYIYI